MVCYVHNLSPTHPCLSLSLSRSLSLLRLFFLFVPGSVCRSGQEAGRQVVRSVGRYVAS